MRCLVGLDDTDSRLGQCTTHLGYRAVHALLGEGCTFSRYPRLVRLNPNVPFKTRGNAAICLDFDSSDPEASFRTVVSLMREMSEVENGANSGAVLVAGELHSRLFRRIYEAAISGIVNQRRVERLLRDNHVSHSFLGNGMGLVGASASIGFNERDDHTYELIAYRRTENLGTRRVVDPESVKRMERKMFPHCLNNYDYSKERVLVTPHGPDPVFLGIRADSPDTALRGFRMLSYKENLLGHIVYASNQCTDAHLASKHRVPLSSYSSGWLEGTVRSVHVGRGRHVYISLESGGSSISAVVYRPTGDLSSAARMLMQGDVVKLYGGVRRPTTEHPSIVNVEKIQVMSIEAKVEVANPRCDRCGGTTKSEGKGKGFECRACGAKPAARSKRKIVLPRSLEPGIYLPSPGAQRHLTKQLIRYGRESGSAHSLVEGWIEAEGVRPLLEPAQSPR